MFMTVSPAAQMVSVDVAWDEEPHQTSPRRVDQRAERDAVAFDPVGLLRLDVHIGPFHNAVSACFHDSDRRRCSHASGREIIGWAAAAIKRSFFIFCMSKWNA